MRGEKQISDHSNHRLTNKRYFNFNINLEKKLVLIYNLFSDESLCEEQFRLE